MKSQSQRPQRRKSTKPDVSHLCGARQTFHYAYSTGESAGKSAHNAAAASTRYEHNIFDSLKKQYGGAEHLSRGNLFLTQALTQLCLTMPIVWFHTVKTGDIKAAEHKASEAASAEDQKEVAAKYQAWQEKEALRAKEAIARETKDETEKLVEDMLSGARAAEPLLSEQGGSVDDDDAHSSPLLSDGINKLSRAAWGVVVNGALTSNDDLNAFAPSEGFASSECLLEGIDSPEVGPRPDAFDASSALCSLANDLESFINNDPEESTRGSGVRTRGGEGEPTDFSSKLRHDAASSKLDQHRHAAAKRSHTAMAERAVASKTAGMGTISRKGGPRTKGGDATTKISGKVVHKGLGIARKDPERVRRECEEGDEEEKDEEVYDEEDDEEIGYSALTASVLPASPRPAPPRPPPPRPCSGKLTTHLNAQHAEYKRKQRSQSAPGGSATSRLRGPKESGLRDQMGSEDPLSPLRDRFAAPRPRASRVRSLDEVFGGSHDLKTAPKSQKARRSGERQKTHEDPRYRLSVYDTSNGWKAEFGEDFTAEDIFKSSFETVPIGEQPLSESIPWRRHTEKAKYETDQRMYSDVLRLTQAVGHRLTYQVSATYLNKEILLSYMALLPSPGANLRPGPYDNGIRYSDRALFALGNLKEAFDAVSYGNPSFRTEIAAFGGDVVLGIFWKAFNLPERPTYEAGRLTGPVQLDPRDKLLSGVSTEALSWIRQHVVERSFGIVAEQITASTEPTFLFETIKTKIQVPMGLSDEIATLGMAKKNRETQAIKKALAECVKKCLQTLFSELMLAGVDREEEKKGEAQ